VLSFGPSRKGVAAFSLRKSVGLPRSVCSRSNSLLGVWIVVDFRDRMGVDVSLFRDVLRAIVYGSEISELDVVGSLFNARVEIHLPTEVRFTCCSSQIGDVLLLEDSLLNTLVPMTVAIFLEPCLSDLFS
jgi:mannose/fructose/N-acetylgalactosamine-specific phosphotransferase system component IID